jgi:hypothetical protein
MYFYRRIIPLIPILVLLPSAAAGQKHHLRRSSSRASSNSSKSPSNSAARVAAEMTKGKINPAENRPGDAVAVTLKNDLRSNGEVVLKKGTVITGVVRSVKRPDTKGAARVESNSQTQSMVEVEWFAPASEKSGENLSIALETVSQNHWNLQPEENGGDCLNNLNSDCKPADLSHHTSSIVATNPALLRMPSVVAVDHQTSSAIEGDLDSSAAGPLFKVGHGELIATGASQQSVDIFSHLRNDTVITSPSRTFEISSGAQMQLLVGMNRK